MRIATFRTRGVILAVMAALAATPVGFAIAQGDGDDGNAGVDTTLPDSPAEIADRAAASEAAGGSPEPGLAPGQEPVDVNVIGTVVPPQAVAACRAKPAGAGSCDVVIAIDEGKLPPGKYSDAELREALQAAGFSGDF